MHWSYGPSWPLVPPVTAQADHDQRDNPRTTPADHLRPTAPDAVTGNHIEASMRYYEQRCHGRTIIHTEIDPDDATQVVDAVNACCWIEAKQLLGYQLSIVQEWLLDLFYEERKRARRQGREA